MDYSYENLTKGVKKSWMPMLDKIFKNEKGDKLFKYLNEQTKKYTIFPYPEDVFAAFKHFEIETTMSCFIAQDPYTSSEMHNNKEIPQAMGLSFSIPKQISRVPPSLKNIYKEIKNSYPDFKEPNHGDLTEWVDNNGLLLLNSGLTVKKGLSNSHQKKWEKFTDQIIEYIADNTKGVVFILLGSFAKSKAALIDEDDHRIIRGVHPSPLSASKGFFNSGIFKTLNRKLVELGKKEFDFTLTSVDRD